MPSRIALLLVGTLLGLAGCTTPALMFLAPDAAEYPDGTLEANVGEVHRLELYEMYWGGAGGSQSVECDSDTAAIVSGDVNVLVVDPPTYATVATGAGDVDAVVTLFHSVGAGTTILTAHCNDMTTTTLVRVSL